MSAPAATPADGPAVGTRGSLGRALEIAAALLLFGWISFAPLSPQWPHTATESFTLPLLVALAAVAALLAGRALDRDRGRRLGDRHDLPFVALLAALLASAAGREQSELAWRVGTQLALLLGCAYAFGKLLAQTRRAAATLVIALLPLSLAVALYATVEVATGSNPVYALTRGNPYYEQYRAAGRAVATQFNPAPLGTYLLVAGFLGGGALLAQERWRRGRRRLVGAALVSVHWLGLALTWSRGAFVGLFAGALLWTLGPRAMTPDRRLRTVAALAALLLGIMTVASLLPPPFDQFGFWRVFGDGGLWAQDRAIRQQAALSMWASAPWLGVGFEHYRLHFADHAGTDPRIAHLAGTPDNTLLTLLAENGALGLAAFLWFAVALVARGLRTPTRQPDAMLLRAATAGLVALLVNFLGYSALYWATPCLLFGVTCGLVNGLAGAPDAGATAGPLTRDRGPSVAGP